MSAGLISHNFSQFLGDLVDAGECLGALFQVLVARVDVGLHGERGVVVPAHLLTMEIGTLRSLPGPDAGHPLQGDGGKSRYQDSS